MGLEDDLELIDFPTTSGEHFGVFKVLQLYCEGRPTMIFGDIYTPHYEILKSFLIKREIRFETLDRPSGGIPAEGGNGKPYNVVGGGFVTVYPESNEFKTPEGSNTFYANINPEFNTIYEGRMIKEGWKKYKSPF